MIEITQAVRAETTGWDRAVKLFQARFDVPFEPVIKNRANAIIGGDDPVIRFRYDGVDVENETLFANLRRWRTQSSLHAVCHLPG